MTKPAAPKSYIAPEVCEAAGIKQSTLRTWRKRGFVVTEKDHAREWTKFTEAEALGVCVLARLIKSGIEPRLAHRVVDELGALGALEKVVAGKPLCAAVYEIDQNLDDRRKPDGFAFKVRWDGEASGPVRLSIDLGEIYDAARRSLRGER